MSFRTTLAAVVVFVSLVPVCLGQGIVAQGARLQDPALAVAADTGDFIVVWNDVDQGTSLGVFARLYDKSGKPKGPAFLVHEKRGGDQVLPRVAADPAGNFIVVWQGGIRISESGVSPGGDGAGTGVFLQRFDRDGKRLGGLTRASASAAGHQTRPNVAVHADGSFEVVWEECTATFRCPSLRVGRFQADGSRRGGELEIAIPVAVSFGGGTFPVPTPHIVAEPDGFAVGWTEFESCYKWYAEHFPVVLHFTEAALPFAEKYRLDDGDCEDATGWDVAALVADRAGSTAAFFNGLADRNTVQRFTPEGSPVGRRSPVGSKNACYDHHGRVRCEVIATAGMGPDGRSAVVWNVDEPTGGPGTPVRYFLQGQLFDRKGQPVGDRFEIPGSSQKSYGRESMAGLDQDGTSTVVWIQSVEEGGAIPKARLRVQQFRFPGKPDGD